MLFCHESVLQKKERQYFTIAFSKIVVFGTFFGLTYFRALRLCF
jgi:hypothetical protein